ncbi:hypothetical protein SAMN05892883_0263 [Jatrophihabitans sp. GAS493]|uniref:sucrase ferredoxin n=1 Tax=Jatrophihabitans sp. GAS493 TaxID=1907575 RepID=UPI000BB8C4E6|nr:sucrase ferredoxin [Jatrophihabitans sp. GAS493]SOD70579.1 hypothetical protein SAMN05892883_0263 [Jatrophihabitans sp. GAS493]
MTAAHHTAPRPRETLDRCALRAQLRGDPMLGTAFPAYRLLLVEQPGPWGHSGLTESHFDRDLAQSLYRRTDAAGARLLAIRRPGRTPAGGPRKWAYVDARPGREVLRWGEFADDREMLEVPLDGSGGVADPSPIYLVCAHSKHDACCALRGRPVAAALAAARPGRVWECSHVGGERFAANVLVLPSGMLYGRVLPFAAAEFADAADSGEVIGALLRGRVGFTPQAQAAMAFAYEHLALREIDQLRLISATPVREGAAVARVAGPHGLIDITVRVERRSGDGLTCAKSGPGAYLSYRAISATAVE